MTKKLLAITGPTASGKTKISLEIAKRLNSEIISSDSLLVYRGLDIGTAKPTKEEREKIHHHLIDIVEPYENYSISDFYQDAVETIRNIEERNKSFLVTGGTGFYLSALINKPFQAPSGSDEAKQNIDEKIKKGHSLSDLHKELESIDPDSAKRIHPNDKYRIFRALEVYYTSGKTMSFFRKKHKESSRQDFETLIIVLNPDKEELISSIKTRTRKMFQDGLLDEVNTLLKKGYSKDLKPLRSIGYRESIQVISGIISPDEAIQEINKNTIALAKRQITWFKKQDFTLWVHPERDTVKIIDTALRFMGV